MGFPTGPLVLITVILLLSSGCSAPSGSPAGPQARVAVTTPAAASPASSASAGSVAETRLPSIESPGPFPHEHAGIKFEGDVDVNCSLQTVHALDLLDAKAHDDFLFVQKHIGVIECRDNWSGMYAWENPPRFAVGRVTRDSGAIWYAGAIAHDSCHSWQYNEYAKDHPGEKVPENLFSGQAAEEECARY